VATQLFFKSANSWAKSAITSPQISEICESANFFLSQIANPQIAKPQISNLQVFHHKTESLFFKFPPFIAKLFKSWLQVCLAEFFFIKI
jgi:hypothetical protein